MQVSADNIVDWLLKRDPQAIVSYNSITKDEYTRAFTAARTLNAGVIDDLYFVMIDVIDKGGTVADFQKIVTPTLKRKGWLGGDDGQIASRLDLIFDTNVARARADGLWDRIQDGKRTFPYLRGVTAGDERVRHPPKSPRSDHRAWQDIVLPVDHWFWRRWGTGHIGFRCRCTVVQLLRSQAARLTVTSEDEVLRRDQRLGEPVFASPAASIQQKVEAATQSSNSGARTPGRPDVDPGQVIDEASRISEALAARAQTRVSGSSEVAPMRYASMTADAIAAELGSNEGKAFSARMRPETMATLALLRARRALKAKQ